jgi:hypothetical protein
MVVFARFRTSAGVLGREVARAVHTFRQGKSICSHNHRFAAKALATTVMINIAFSPRLVHASGSQELAGPEKRPQKSALKTYDNCDKTCGEGKSHGDLKRAPSCDSAAICQLPKASVTGDARAAPDFAILNSTRLISWPDNREFSAQELWQKRPVVVLVVRRMGCPLCRAAFAEVSSRRADFDALGVGLAAISQQDIGARDFLDAVWPNLPLYIDPEDGFRSALGGEVCRLPPRVHVGF